MAERQKSNREVFFPRIRSEYVPSLGILTMRTDLPQELTANFKEAFLREKPWDKPGIPLSQRSKIVCVGDLQLVEKASRFPLPFLKNLAKYPPGKHLNDRRFETSRTNAHKNFPVALFAKAETMKRRYEAAYPEEEIYVEEPIAAFVRQESGEITMYYQYYPEANKDPYEISPEAETLKKRLEMLGVHFHDGFQFILTKDPRGSAKQRIVIIDHEDIDIR